MLSLIEVECPHCSARGQVMIPPVGTMIIGPCPQCKGLVVIFCGQALPLDREIMEEGDTQARTEHLMNVLTGFLRERIGCLFQDNEEEPEFDGKPNLIDDEDFQQFVRNDLPHLDHPSYFEQAMRGGKSDQGPKEVKEIGKLGPAEEMKRMKGKKADQTNEITQSELKRFIEVDLKLLDNPAYFKSVFE